MLASGIYELQGVQCNSISLHIKCKIVDTHIVGH
uniref:Uncharacterized protein n=1 Tax=Arundo donax TaxID=35708 RepID=A0A0A9BQS3_ARUDO